MPRGGSNQHHRVAAITAEFSSGSSPSITVHHSDRNGGRLRSGAGGGTQTTLESGEFAENCVRKQGLGFGDLLLLTLAKDERNCPGCLGLTKRNGDLAAAKKPREDLMTNASGGDDRHSRMSCELKSQYFDAMARFL